MLTLDYSFDPAEINKANAFDLASVSAVQMNYYLFCGNIRLRADSITFDANWGWVPILDFAVQFFEIANGIGDGEIRVLEFTESEAEIRFYRNENNIEISGNYTEGVALVSLDEVQKEALKFLTRVVDDLIARWPRLTDNIEFMKKMALVKPA